MENDKNQSENLDKINTDQPIPSFDEKNDQPAVITHTASEAALPDQVVSSVVHEQVQTQEISTHVHDQVIRDEIRVLGQTTQSPQRSQTHPGEEDHENISVTTNQHTEQDKFSLNPENNIISDTSQIPNDSENVPHISDNPQIIGENPRENEGDNQNNESTIPPEYTRENTHPISSEKSNDYEKILIKEIIKEIPVEKIIEKVIIREVPVEKIVERTIIREIPTEKISEKVIKVLDQKKFNFELRKRAISLLSGALQQKRIKRDIRIQKVLLFIQKEKTATSRQLQNHFHLSAMTVYRYTKYLVAHEGLKFVGKRRSRKYSLN